MTEIEAYKKALDLWVWLYDNPGKGKSDSPFYDELLGMITGCPLCHYYCNITRLNDDYCDYCIGGVEGSTCFNLAYTKWSFNKNLKSASGYIASKIRRRLYDLLADKVDNSEVV